MGAGDWTFHAGSSAFQVSVVEDLGFRWIWRVSKTTSGRRARSSGVLRFYEILCRHASSAGCLGHLNSKVAWREKSVIPSQEQRESGSGCCLQCSPRASTHRKTHRIAIPGSGEQYDKRPANLDSEGPIQHEVSLREGSLLVAKETSSGKDSSEVPLPAKRSTHEVAASPRELREKWWLRQRDSFRGVPSPCASTIPAP